MKTLEPIIRKVFFYGAFVLLAIAAIEKIANLFFRRSLMSPYFVAHDFLVFAAVALIFCIAMQLHQIRLLLGSKS